MLSSLVHKLGMLNELTIQSFMNVCLAIDGRSCPGP
jgi:hypothetical protein